jgi:alpha-ribazole phosphatase
MPRYMLHAWRHPRATDVEGRCIGHTDVPVDARRAKRVAYCIRALARKQGLPRIVVTSPLRRSRAVGRWLALWGWQHVVDPLLAEIDFGAWDGRAWAKIPRGALDAWCADFLAHTPGGGESVAQLLDRVLRFDPGPARVIVTHGGWLSAAQWLTQPGAQRPAAADWPAAPKHGERIDLPWPPIAALRSA